jgi:hypothetical protein
METKESTQASRFDECVAELSPESQEYFRWAVKTISESLVKHSGGEMCAKAILYAICERDKSFFKKELS